MPLLEGETLEETEGSDVSDPSLFFLAMESSFLQMRKAEFGIRSKGTIMPWLAFSPHSEFEDSALILFSIRLEQ
jgi:hypothetical protein